MASVGNQDGATEGVGIIRQELLEIASIVDNMFVVPLWMKGVTYIKAMVVKLFG